MTSSVLEAAIFALMCWALPARDGKPIMKAPGPQDLGSCESEGSPEGSDDDSPESRSRSRGWCSRSSEMSEFMSPM